MDQNRQKAGIHMGAGDRAVPHREKLVHIGHFAVLGEAQGALALVVIGVALGVFRVLHLLDAVFFVPDDGSSCAVDITGPAGLVAVGVIGEAAAEGVAVATNTVLFLSWSVNIEIYKCPIFINHTEVTRSSIPHNYFIFLKFMFLCKVFWEPTKCVYPY